LEIEDLTSSVESVTSRLHEDANRPFSFEHGPLFRLIAYRTGPAAHILLFSIHHIISDFWSLQILIEELAQAYAAERAREFLDLEPLGLQFADYVASTRAMLASPEGERLWSYWRRKLAGELPDL